jgi:phosphatidate cytidylyltransferase
LLHRDGALFLCAVLFLAAAALRELDKMAERRAGGVYCLSGMATVFILCLTAYFFGMQAQLCFIVLLAGQFIMVEGILRHKTGDFKKVLYSFLAVIYIGVPFAQLILLRAFQPTGELITLFGPMPFGEAVLWLALVGTWASDTFAFLLGTLFGRHKLCPALSPHKSWEGVLAGFIGCLLSVWFAATYVLHFQEFAVSWYFGGGPAQFFFSFFKGINIWFLGVLIGLFAPLGDLAESRLKRFCGVKDAGSFFPGHGGVLDRLDSLLFVIPVVYFYTYFAAG